MEFKFAVRVEESLVKDIWKSLGNQAREAFSSEPNVNFSLGSLSRENTKENQGTDQRGTSLTNSLKQILGKKILTDFIGEKFMQYIDGMPEDFDESSSEDEDSSSSSSPVNQFVRKRVSKASRGGSEPGSSADTEDQSLPDEIKKEQSILGEVAGKFIIGSKMSPVIDSLLSGKPKIAGPKILSAFNKIVNRLEESTVASQTDQGAPDRIPTPPPIEQLSMIERLNRTSDLISPKEF